MPIPKDPIKAEEWRRKNSEAHKGIYPSKETRLKMGLAHKGIKHPPRTEEWKRKQSESHKGKSPSETTRNKLCIALQGRIRPPRSNEWCNNISKGNKGKILPKEQRQKIGDSMKGEKSHLWKGGISFEPYCPKFTKEFKERVRSFFGHTCVECGTPQNGYKLHVHHVNFNKETCCDNSVPLFVPLCRSCHVRTNHNRIFWEYWFTEMITRQCGGRCYFTTEDMRNLTHNQFSFSDLVS